MKPHAILLATLLASVASGQGEESSPLERDPAELPRAEADAFAEWTPQSVQPEELRPVIQRMSKAYSNGELPIALGEILIGLESVPDYPPLLHQGGVIYFKLRRYGDAQEMFERFVAAAPEYAGQTRALGHCYYTLGDYERATQHYELVLSKEPKMIEARRGLGLALFRTGDSEGALRELGLVVEANPKHADAWTWIAQVHFEEDDAKSAQTSIAQALDADEFSARAWFLKAQISWELGEDEVGDEAHETYRKLDRVAQEARALEARLALDPHQLELLWRLHELHSSVENLAAVREVSTRVMREAPEDVAIRIRLLDGLVALKDVDGAQACALSLERIAGESADAWKRLEQYWNLVGNRRKRTEAAERYLRLRFR